MATQSIKLTGKVYSGYGVWSSSRPRSVPAMPKTGDIRLSSEHPGAGLQYSVFDGLSWQWKPLSIRSITYNGTLREIVSALKGAAKKSVVFTDASYELPKEPAKKKSKKTEPELPAGTVVSLSGRIFGTESVRSHCDLPAVSRKPQVGDIKVICRLDGYGIAAVKSGHTSSGVSGNILSFVFDGQTWRNFDLLTCVHHEALNYHRQLEKDWKVPFVVEILEAHKTAKVTYRNGAFVLPGNQKADIQRQRTLLKARRLA